MRSGEIGHAGPFNVSTTAPAQVFSHFFENAVGSGHMSLTAREDWRTHIRMAARDLGVKHIRGHGLLDDDMSVSYARGKHAFYNIDSLVDLLLSIGMRPIFELSFMPGWLTSGNNSVCHYHGNSDPPASYRFVRSCMRSLAVWSARWYAFLCSLVWCELQRLG